MARIVHGAGRVPNDVLLVGEAPGREEAAQGVPFVGRSGREQDIYLQRYGLNARAFYRTNVVKAFIEGNPDPGPELIEEWTPALESEIEQVRPKVIFAVGRFATQWFLGEGAYMDLVHGIPHRGGEFDPTRKGRARGAVIVPIYHPAAGFYDNDVRAVIDWDYGRAADVLTKVRAGQPIEFKQDLFPKPWYKDVGGAELACIFGASGKYKFSIDTEGYPSDPWSLQVCEEPGTGFVLRTDRADFAYGIRFLQSIVDSPDTTVIIHNAMYDIEMCTAMNLNLSRARIWDSMYAAYLMRLERQGLKDLAYRWCGMRMREYEEVVGDAGNMKQVEYLAQVMTQTWPKPVTQSIEENDGTFRKYTPQPIERRAESILRDFAAKPVDLRARWLKMDSALRRMVEGRLGRFPIGTLADIALEDAITYAARDADATLRLHHVLEKELERQGLSILMKHGMEVLPIFEEMQRNGMPAQRSRFEDLAEDMRDQMRALQYEISVDYFGGRPFNPASSTQVATLMRRQNLQGEKKTKTGKVSTGRKSIEHLRDQSQAIDLVLTWREHEKILDSFCLPIIEGWAHKSDIGSVRCSLLVTRTATRRLAAKNPNLLAIPVRHELGRQVRDCYVCPEGRTFGAWDLSQVEMRYMAHLSHDQRMIEWILSGRDIHSEVAAIIFKIPLVDVPGLDQMTGEEKKAALKRRYAPIHPLDHRYPAKRAGFGIITNIGGGGLYDQLRMYGCKGWDERSCQHLIDDWLGVFAGVAEFLKACRREVRKRGIVWDVWGMPRYLPGVWAQDAPVRAESERAASSHKIQGGAQGIIQRSMSWLKPQIWALQDAGVPVEWRLQIHDELILTMPEDDEGIWIYLNGMIKDALTTRHGLKLSVPLEAEGHRCKTWGGLK